MGQMDARQCPALPSNLSFRDQLRTYSKVEDVVRERSQGEGEDRDVEEM